MQPINWNEKRRSAQRWAYIDAALSAKVTALAVVLLFTTLPSWVAMQGEGLLRGVIIILLFGAALFFEMRRRDAVRRRDKAWLRAAVLEGNDVAAGRIFRRAKPHLGTEEAVFLELNGYGTLAQSLREELTWRHQRQVGIVEH